MTPRFLTLDQACEHFQIKDPRTLHNMAAEGKIRIESIGSLKRVPYASIVAFEEGRSEWHARQSQSQSHDGSGAVVRFGIGQGAKSRGRRRLSSQTELNDTNPFTPRMKRQRG